MSGENAALSFHTNSLFFFIVPLGDDQVMLRTSNRGRFNDDWGADQRRLEPTRGASDGRALVAPELGIEDTNLGKVPTASTKIDQDWCVKFQEWTVSRCVTILGLAKGIPFSTRSSWRVR
jgi:hypothetical protein